MSDFVGFRFGPYHSNDLHLIATSSGNRFQKNLLPNPTDYTLDIPGGDGKFYVGQTFQSREISINVSFTDMDELTFRRIAQIFSTDKLQDLVFDEQPYKTYRAKCKSAPQFKYICFKDPQTQQRIYKGEGTINFVCYKPFAYCFNKYVVTAADYYKTTMPEEILNPMSVNYNPYIHDVPPSLTDEIKLHYNRDHNMNTTWDGGYPTIEQVQWGELYFTDKDGNKKLISDIRRYWDNVPKWQVGAKLLATPTLDYEQELIYMPQYSCVNYYNMETGLNKQNALIGSRILVYNPGDLPINFTLELNNLNNKLRNIEEPYRFRISRYNVQRLSVKQAVDWIGLETYNKAENDKFKYGKRYVGILEAAPVNGSTESVGSDLQPQIRYLDESHPNHLYFTEPLPRKDVVKYLKMFIYQTRKKLWNHLEKNESSRNIQQYNQVMNKIKNYEEEAEKEFHNYEINLSACISDDEVNEIYWKLIISIFNGILSCFVRDGDNLYYIFENQEDIEEWLRGFLFNPLEFVTIDEQSYPNYGELDFNVYEPLNYITPDYIEVEASFHDKNDNVPAQLNLIFDSEKRLLYNEIEDEEQFEKTIKKVVYNDHIKTGNWFQIPPGWSLIEITPVLLEGTFKGKRWLEARPFIWGGMGADEKAIFNICETKAIVDYLVSSSPTDNLIRDYGNLGFPELANRTDLSREEINNVIKNQGSLSDDEYRSKLETYIQFANWWMENDGYESYAGGVISIGKGIWNTQIARTELDFLKLLNNYWRLAHLDKNGFPTSDVEDWWWYASSFIWSNFPPAYWGYVDVLNEAKISYIPQYY